MKNFLKRCAEILICVAIMVLIAVFFVNVFKYFILTDNIKLVVETAGKVGWTDSLVERYDAAVAKRLEFVENSDVAAFLYYSAFSFIGKIVRFAVAIILMFVFYVSGWYIFNQIKSCFHRIRKYFRKKIRKKVKKMQQKHCEKY